LSPRPATVPVAETRLAALAPSWEDRLTEATTGTPVVVPLTAMLPAFSTRAAEIARLPEVRMPAAPALTAP